MLSITFGNLDKNTTFVLFIPNTIIGIKCSINIVMSTTTLSQATLILNTCNYITIARDILLGALVSYTEDPVRYARRVRMLCQLSAYEVQIIEKINKFQTDNLADLDSTLNEIKHEIDQITNIYA